MKAKLKYPLKLGDTTLPPGTVGKVVGIEAFSDIFPNLTHIHGSNQIGVEFEGVGHATIVHMRQVEIFKD